MKLYMVGASPYVRKVRAAAVALGLDSEIEAIIANPHERPPALIEVNPLSKIPVLIDNSGRAHADSYVICEFLDSQSNQAELIPAFGVLRQDVLHRHALAHGIMECAVIRRVEGLKTPEPDRIAWMERQQKTIDRALDWFEADTALAGGLTLDRLTLGAALGFLDFRFPTDLWRPGRERLTDWFAKMDQTPPMEKTRPFE